jgi:hypothetical protein
VKKSLKDEESEYEIAPVIKKVESDESSNAVLTVMQNASSVWTPEDSGKLTASIDQEEEKVSRLILF